jgi:hypothetical protein
MTVNAMSRNKRVQGFLQIEATNDSLLIQNLESFTL